MTNVMTTRRNFICLTLAACSQDASPNDPAGDSRPAIKRISVSPSGGAFGIVYSDPLGQRGELQFLGMVEGRLRRFYLPDKTVPWAVCFAHSDNSLFVVRRIGATSSITRVDSRTGIIVESHEIDGLQPESLTCGSEPGSLLAVCNLPSADMAVAILDVRTAKRLLLDFRLAGIAAVDTASDGSLYVSGYGPRDRDLENSVIGLLDGGSAYTTVVYFKRPSTPLAAMTYTMAGQDGTRPVISTQVCARVYGGEEQVLVLMQSYEMPTGPRGWSNYELFKIDRSGNAVELSRLRSQTSQLASAKTADLSIVLTNNSRSSSLSDDYTAKLVTFQQPVGIDFSPIALGNKT